MNHSAHPLSGRESTRHELVRPTLLAIVLVAVAILAVLVSRVGGQAFEAKLWQQDSQFADEFGRTVFLSGGTAVVTEPGIDETGAVHVYERLGTVWTSLTTLTAPDASAGARFGDALGLVGDTLAVGAPYDAEHGVDAGAVYVFQRDRAGTPGDPTDDRWSMMAKLYPATGPVPGRFGLAVSLRGGTLLVGARGGAYVFVRDDLGTPHDPHDDIWIEQAHITPLVALPSQLGRAVLLLPSAQTALVGGDHEPSSSKGLVRVVHRDDSGTPADPLDDTWTDADGLTDDGAFGQSLAFAGSTLLVGGGWHAPVPPEWKSWAFVGAYDLDDAGTPGDPADDTWIPAGTLPDPGYPVFNGFGATLALTSGTGPQVALVSTDGIDWSWGVPPPSFDLLRSFRREAGGWTFTGSLVPPDDAYDDGFGKTLAIDGDMALVGARGAPYDEVYEEPPVEGAAWVLDLGTPSPWSKPSLYGQPLAGWGRLEAGWPVTLRVYNSLTSDQPVVLVIGLSAIYAPFKGNTMVPLPQMLITLFTGPQDDAALGGFWPARIPSGTEFWVQGWIPPHPGGLWHCTQVVLATQP